MLMLGDFAVTMGAKASFGAGRVERRFLDENEFNRLYARTARPLTAYVRRLTGDPEATRDLVQEAYLRILRARVPVMDEKQTTSYLYRIASRLVQDRWRHQGVDRRWREQLPAPTSSRGGDRDSALDLDRVLERLRPRDRAVVWLAYVEGRRHAEIAEILGLKPASVRVLLFRARRKLVDVLTTEGLAPEA